MTQGKNGATLFQNKQFDKIKTPPVSNVVDTTGAGDMFAAGTLFKLQNNSSAQDSATFGCKVAAKLLLSLVRGQTMILNLQFRNSNL